MKYVHDQLFIMCYQKPCLFVQYDLVFASNSLHLKAVYIVIRGEKKTKPRKLEKKIRKLEKKNQIVKKNRLKFKKTDQFVLVSVSVL